MAAIYSDGSYLNENPDWHVSASDWKAQQIIRLLEKNDIAFRTAVEVGCGAGHVLLHLSEYFPGAKFEGFEISLDARKLWPKTSENRSYRLEDFTSSSGSYDLLLLIDVFEHVDDYLGFLRTIGDRSTHFVFHIPLDMNVQMLVRDRHTHLRKSIGHLHYFSKSSALETLDYAGYRLEDYFYTAGALEAPGDNWTFKRHAMNVLRKMMFKLLPDLTVRLLGGYSLMVLCSRDTGHVGPE
ncbi:class I SAM-dependent methyltransferase [Pyruvatibacter mobilis]|uniref:class I SAM-dependent methyltransferase n=1 Tax=Pyruvatibacter mobilis TaxID=1712261 RepID=UPI003D14F88F